MRKIASPQDLSSELRHLLAYSEGHQPSRAVLASELRSLADRVSMEHPSPEALKTYLREHPGADPKNHTVVKEKETGGGSSKEEFGSSLTKLQGLSDMSKKEMWAVVDDIASKGESVLDQDGQSLLRELRRAVDHPHFPARMVADKVNEIRKYLKDM